MSHATNAETALGCHIDSTSALNHMTTVVSLHSNSTALEQAKSEFRLFMQSRFSYHSVWAAILIVAISLCALITTANAQFPAPCDTDKSCVSRAYTTTIGSGTTAQYARVTNTTSQNSVRTEMTYECWINATRQSGNRVFIAGRWGPRGRTGNEEENDVWVLYIDTNNDLVFELGHPTSQLRQADNTIARIPFSSYYGTWTHIAAVFDGTATTATLIINGSAATQQIAQNNTHPISRLRTPVGTQRLMIGVIENFANETNARTFVGQMDEIRLWSVARTRQDIWCSSTRSLNGNEAGLVMYLRCNEAANNQNMCDATGNGNAGLLLAGAACQAPSPARSVEQKIVFKILPEPSTKTEIREDVPCDSVKTWRIVIQDTSFCSGPYPTAVNYQLATGNTSQFRLNKTSATLLPGSWDTVTVTLNTNRVGTLQTELRVTGNNRCMTQLRIPIVLNRFTGVRYDSAQVRYRPLFAGCVTQPDTEIVVTIFNQTNLLGAAQTQPIEVRGWRTNMPAVFTVVSPAMPFTIPPGGTQRIRIRFTSQDTAALYRDTLRMLTNDPCPGSPIIPISGDVEELLAIRMPDGKTRIDTITLPATCPGDISDSRAWNWFNLSSLSNVTIDSIYIPKDFIMVRTPRIPPAYVLRPFLRGGAEFEKYIRFRPSRAGNVFDSVVFYALHPNGCRIVRKYYVRSRGLENTVSFQVPNDTLDFGDVIVGKEKTITVDVKSLATIDNLQLLLFLKAGGEFLFTGTRSTLLRPGAVNTLTVTFRPVDTLRYRDELCANVFCSNSYSTFCIPVKGRGIIEKFRFSPIVSTINNVIGCREDSTEVEIINESNVVQTLSNFRITNDPTGTFTPLFPQTNLAGYTVTLQPNQRQKFRFRFRPNNSTTDIAVKAYLRYQTSLTGDEWLLQLYGTSATPKLYITPLTTFGTIEAGDTRIDTLTLENISSLDVDVNALALPTGFEFVQFLGGRTLPATLVPRDSVRFVIRFRPTTDSIYNTTMTITGSGPCPGIKTDAELQARSQIIRLDAPISLQNFSYVRPCEWRERDIPLVNQSLVNSMRIDTAWISGPDTSLFTYTSFYQQASGGTGSWSIPPQKTDTVRIRYQPRTLADPRFLASTANFRMAASGAGWADTFNIFLAGRRAMLFLPDQDTILFPRTPVDVYAPMPRGADISTLSIPGLDANPDQEKIRIDSVTFLPDERIFTAVDTLGNPLTFPYTIDPDSATRNKLPVRFRFRPRSVRLYTARAVIHYSTPCTDTDTTIFLRGEGVSDFKYSLDFDFDSTRVNALDTFRILTCDTAKIPVYSARKLPLTSATRSLIDIRCRVSYDTAKVELVGTQSTFTTPSVLAPTTSLAGKEILLKNCQDVDSTNQILLLYFVPKQKLRDSVLIEIDSLTFDSEEVLRYNLSDARGDRAMIIVQQPAMNVGIDTVRFGQVEILNCTTQTFRVGNTGDVPILVDSLLPFSKTVRVVGLVPPRGNYIAVGDSAEVTVEFCPRNTTPILDSMEVRSTAPCGLQDSLFTTGVGFAPTFELMFSTDPTFTATPAAISGNLGDTITIPVFLDKDINRVYNGTTYWLNGLNFSLGIQWNKLMLRYLGATSIRGSSMNAKTLVANATDGQLMLEFSNIDTLMSGKIADLRFEVTIPDTVRDSIRISPPQLFRTDSLYFLDLQPSSQNTQTTTSGQCGAEVIKYSDGTRGGLYEPVPTPSIGKVSIRYDLMEDTPVLLQLYSTTGEHVRTLYSSNNQFLRFGQHSFEADVSELPSGVYYLSLSAGRTFATRPLVIVR